MATRTRSRRSRYSLRPRWMTAKRTIALILVSVLVVLGVYGVRTAFALAKIFHTDPFTAVADVLGGKDHSSIQDAVNSQKRINIALYGYGGPGHDGPYLTDSIMVVSLQPQSDGSVRVGEVSVPRDFYVPIDLGGGGRDFDRINQAYADGMDGKGPVPADHSEAGAAVANPTLGRLLGLQIDYFVGIDFSAFLSAVDAVGGVDINVPNAFTDNEYPAGECYNGGNCGFQQVHFDAGRQHMDGATALVYSRSRHGNNNEGSDFARSKRQQLVLAAIKQRLFTIGGVGKLPDLLNALGDHVKTNLSINDAQAVYALVKDIDSASVVHVSFDDQNFLYECDYPRECGAAYIYAHDSSYKQLAQFTRMMFVDHALQAAPVQVVIKDGSGNGEGASTRWAAIFGQLGWRVDDQGPVRHRSGTTQIIDDSGGSGSAVAKWFADYFGVAVSNPSSPGSSGPTVTIILGQDEERAFNNHPGVGH